VTLSCDPDFGKRAIEGCVRATTLALLEICTCMGLAEIVSLFLVLTVLGAGI